MTATSNSDTLVTIFGGSGFVGRHVVRAIAERGYRIRVAVRRPDLAYRLQPLGRVSQIQPVQANIRNPASIEAAVRDAAVVVNLVGILYERGRQRFEAVHRDGAEAVARAAKDHGARLIHVSAIGADAKSSALYAQTKAAAEKAVQAHAPDAVIFRPSVVFGPDDDFFNKFGAMARIAPVLPLVGGGRTKFQPVFAGDVGEAVARAVAGEAKAGVYELGGPEVLSFRELMDFVLATTGRRRLLLPIPFWGAKFLSLALQFLPNPPLTPDQVELLRYDNVVSAEAERAGRTLKGLGIQPHAIEAIVPYYLQRFSKCGQFTRRMA